MSRLECALARVGEDLELPGLMGHHRTGCLHCQVRIARAQRLRRELGSLRHDVVPAPPDLSRAVMAEIAQRASRRAGSAPKLAHGIAATAGAVVASAAGAVALALWRRSHSPA